MTDFLVDCNHVSAALNKVAPIRDRIRQQRRAGHRFISCYPVLCELEAGIQLSADPADLRRRLILLLRNVRLWPIDAGTTRFYGEVFHELRRKGRVLSQVDMMLAALARQHQLVILTTDRDFEGLPDLKREDWASDSQ